MTDQKLLTIAELNQLIADKEAELSASRKRSNALAKDIRELKSLLTVNVREIFSSEPTIDPNLFGYGGK